METLDVTIIEPRLKHPTIFKQFDDLEAGDSIIIHNDHDPMPLYYQMVAERGEVFDWEYLIKGPTVWEVKIAKLKEGQSPSTIGEIVAKDHRKVEVFKKFGLDFCCGGEKTVKQACDEKGIDALKVEAELKQTETQAKSREHNYNEWEASFLAEYILNNHHNYANDALPFIKEFSDKVANVHGHSHPELKEMKECFDALKTELADHMLKEERILFPYINELTKAKKANTPISAPHFGTVQNPIRMMELEHDGAGDLLKKLRLLSNDYTLPQDACGSYQILFSSLQELEADLHQHIHLENNVLFPKAKQLELEVLG